MLILGAGTAAAHGSTSAPEAIVENGLVFTELAYQVAASSARVWWMKSVRRARSSTSRGR
nr:hypothetical protein KPHV_47230 [Kitasatospora purpeofusca]